MGWTAGAQIPEGRDNLIRHRVQELFPGDKDGWRVKLITRFHLVQRSRIMYVTSAKLDRF
jgi:hypothetical protein